MLDYLFQHFYSTLAILGFFLAILILRACGKRGRSWIAASTAPFGCMTFLVIFLLLAALITWSFGFFTLGPTVENVAFVLAWLAAIVAALAVISRLTDYYLREDKSASKLYPGKSRKLLSVQLRNKGILLFVLIGAISCAIDIVTVPFPVPELPPGSALSASIRVPLPPEVPLDVRISSRVTNRFFGECDFDLTVHDQAGRKHIFPAILINPGGGSSITIYRLRPECSHRKGSLVFTNEVESCLFNMDTMQMKSMSGPASNYPLPSRDDLHGPDMDLRLEVVGLYQGLSCISGAEHAETTRAHVLKILKDVQP
ncbi:hypothetical protein [uncultured Akkermansia sp.]|uniref:hypothetical protein n=1 Tax=uncultured Akkermansia sp. TaxID=512294 RepID=UPI00265D34E2|nr:hypothetical protein [uncultured Akkermansia sp.]